MPRTSAEIPSFGLYAPELVYQPRPAAYAVIVGDDGQIAVVKGRRGEYFLPGGGAWPDETPEQTVTRELHEELARSVRLMRRLGEAVQYFSSGGVHYQMHAVFFAAEFAGEAEGVGEHKLYWLATDEIEAAFFHQCHAWAVQRRIEMGELV